MNMLISFKQNYTEKSFRYGGIDLLKHLLAFFVIFQHMSSESRYSSELNSFIQEIVSYIGGAVMGFFLISGFFFRPSETIKLSVSKIFKRMMLPFFIFSLLYAILMWLLGKGNLKDGLWQTVTLHGAGMQLYYLSYLFVISSAYMILSFFAKKINVSFNYILSIILVISFVTSLFLPTLSPTGSDYRLFPIYVLCFGIGISFSILKKKSYQKFYFLVMGVIVASFLIGIFDYRFYHLSFVSFLLLCAYFISINVKSVQKNFHGSDGIYLLHTPIVNFTISSLLMMIGLSGYLNLFSSLLLTYIICLIVTLLFIRYLPFYKWVFLE